MTTEPPVFKPVEPDELIRDVHLMAEDMGFRRLRVDRSGFGGTPDKPGCWFEVGYASKQVIVRTSIPDLGATFNLDRQTPADLDEVAVLLTRLTEQTKTEVTP